MACVLADCVLSLMDQRLVAALQWDGCLASERGGPRGGAQPRPRGNPLPTSATSPVAAARQDREQDPGRHGECRSPRAAMTDLTGRQP